MVKFLIEIDGTQGKVNMKTTSNIKDQNKSKTQILGARTII